MDRLKWLIQQEASGRLRKLTPLTRHGSEGVLPVDGRMLHDFSSNDYLALSTHSSVIAGAREALEQAGAGAGAARLMSGDLTIHHELEEELAALKEQEAALLFGSGFLANCGVIPALVGRHDVIFSDRLNHASIYDGCRLASSRLIRFRHNDLDHLEDLLKSQRGDNEALIVVESLYSMDGDRCPLPELVRLKEKYNCLLMVDEAHATGLFGAQGGGLLQEWGLAAGVDLAVGTLGKALGSYGAYVAADRKMIDFLVNRARSFIYSTALPPAAVGASLAAVRLVRSDPALREDLFQRVDFFKEKLGRRLQELGDSQIIPIKVGDSEQALALANAMRELGFYLTAVRPPTVPDGTARLRISITLHHSLDVLERAAVVLLKELSSLESA